MTTLRTLNVPASNQDLTASFRAKVKHLGKFERTLTCYLFHSEREGKFYVMQKSATVQSTYSDEQNAERERLWTEEVVNHGDHVEVCGETYEVVMLGDYSDAGYLKKIAA